MEETWLLPLHAVGSSYQNPQTIDQSTVVSARLLAPHSSYRLARVVIPGISICRYNRRAELGTLDATPAEPVENGQVLAPVLFVDLNRLGYATATRKSQAGEIDHLVIRQCGVDDNAILLHPAMLDTEVAANYGVAFDVIGLLPSHHLHS